MKVILLNGPPGCGKDFAGQILMDLLPKSVVMKFAKELKERTHALYRLTRHDGRPHAHDAYEHCKDTPMAVFHGRTPRLCYISVSENLIKPLHGDYIFGQWLASAMEAAPMYDTFIVTDSGFASEAEVLIKRFGTDNVQLIRIHREGHDFSSDSRSYLDLGVQCHDVMNCGTPAFAQSLKTCLSSVGW